MIELKPCPFCGSDADVRMGDCCLWVECKTCGCRTNAVAAGDTYGRVSLTASLDKVTKRWNRRADDEMD